MDGKTVTGIILAAGSSIRFRQDKNKNLFIINGKPIIWYSLDVFNNCKEINDIILVIKPEEKEEFEKIVNSLEISKPLKYVSGGETRKQSVYNALKETHSDFVVIHDGARPRIKEEYISSCLKEMQNYKGVTVGVKSKDTIKICNSKGIVQKTTNRENTYIIQTPQCFHRGVLQVLHEVFEDDETITDDCMILEKSGMPVKVIPGDYTNIKVTTFEDVKMVQE